MVHTRCINKNLVAPFEQSVKCYGGGGGAAKRWIGGLGPRVLVRGLSNYWAAKKQFGLIAMHQYKVGV